MKIPLNEFEQHIDETILKRGYQYFKKGLVNEPEMIGPGEYEAIVEGTDPYTVRLSIKNDVITDYVCSCPYDLGPVCKHVVAVIFHLQQSDIELEKKPKKKRTEGKKVPKKKTSKEQIDEILEKLSHDDLIDYIKKHCEKERTFQQLFLANFAFLVNSESKDLYAQQIRAVLKAAADRNGFVGYSGSRQVGIAVNELTERARNLIEESHYQSAFYIACAVLEEMTKALQFAEDSNGDIGGGIYEAIDLLQSLTFHIVEPEPRDEFFNYCLDAFKKKLFKGWDWHLTMLDLATHIVKNEQESKLIHALLDTIENEGSSWSDNRIQTIRLELIHMMEGPKKAKLYLEQHISNPDFRKMAIDSAILQKDYSAAILLAEDGVKNDSSGKSGLVNDWKDILLKIYTIKQDNENIIKYARDLFMNAYREKGKYFKIMKSNIPVENWSDFLDQIIVDILKKNKRYDNGSLAQIYIWEERWDKLFDYVKKNVDIRILEEYDKYLIKDYANEISGFYQTAILEFIEDNVGRSYYKNACRYLRKLIKMGFREKADFVILELKKRYPQRRALMEELDRV